MKCNTCANENYCYDGNHQLTRDGCADNGFTAYVPQTNADKIRSMSDWEMAEWLADILNHCDNKKPEELCLMSCPLYKCCNDQPSDNIEDWLKSPVNLEVGK